MANIQNITQAIEALKNLAANLPPAVTIDATLTQSGMAADAKIVGDLLNTLADDEDAIWLLTELGILQHITDEIGAVLTDASGNVLTDETGAVLVL